MLIEPHIEALLVDEELADQVYELWDARLLSDELAAWARVRVITLAFGLKRTICTDPMVGTNNE